MEDKSEVLSIYRLCKTCGKKFESKVFWSRGVQKVYTDCMVCRRAKERYIKAMQMYDEIYNSED